MSLPMLPSFTLHRLLALFALLASLLALAPTAHANPIEPEKAFAMRAQALDAQTVEVVFDVAKDYYLYGDKFRFEAEKYLEHFAQAGSVASVDLCHSLRHGTQTRQFASQRLVEVVHDVDGQFPGRQFRRVSLGLGGFRRDRLQCGDDPFERDTLPLAGFANGPTALTTEVDAMFLEHTGSGGEFGNHLAHRTVRRGGARRRKDNLEVTHDRLGIEVSS